MRGNKWEKMILDGRHRRVIRRAPEPWKSLACASILGSLNPENELLCFIVVHGSFPCKVQACRILFERDLKEPDLNCLSKYAPGIWAEKARRLLLKK